MDTYNHLRDLQELQWAEKVKHRIGYKSIYVSCLKWQNYRDGEEINGCQVLEIRAEAELSGIWRGREGMVMKGQ